MKYFSPIIVTELYLLLTLLVFSFGPIEYYLDNALEFWLYIALYQSSMIIGYIVAIMPLKKKFEPIVSTKAPSVLVIRFLIFLAFIACLIGHKNITMSESLLPLNLLDDVMKGVQGSELQYIDKIERLNSYSGDKLLNIIYFFVAFSKVVIIPVIVFYWDRLSFSERVLALIISCLPVLSGISIGTNKPLFDFVIFYGSSLVLFFAGSFFRTGSFNFKERKFFVYGILIAFIGALYFFGTAMQGRGGDVSYIESTSGFGHIKINPAYNNLGESDFLSYVYVWLSNYLVQGYYGFSQALNQNFTTTFGIGNSQFLMRQFEWVTGIDLSSNTYQHKIDAIWGAEAQWHSLYSHLANDFHFFGVAIWSFIMGFYLAKLWKSFIEDDNGYAKLLLPVFALLIVFIPANNQVFGYLETISTFGLLSALWLYGMRKRIFKCIKVHS